MASLEGRQLYIKSLKHVLEHAMRIEDLKADFLAACMAAQDALAEGGEVRRRWQMWEAENLYARLMDADGEAEKRRERASLVAAEVMRRTANGEALEKTR